MKLNDNNPAVMGHVWSIRHLSSKDIGRSSKALFRTIQMFLTVMNHYSPKVALNYI